MNLKNYYDKKCRNPRCEQPDRMVKAGEGYAFRGACKPTGQGNYWDVYHPECAKARSADPMDDYRDFEPSRYQQAALDAWLETDTHLILDAVAGSGKTKTILWIIARSWNDWKLQLGRKPRVLVCAFNRSIREELEVRIPPNTAQAMTLNSFGNAILSNYLKRIGVESDLEGRLAWNVVAQLYPRDDEELGDVVNWANARSLGRVYEVMFDEPPPEGMSTSDLRKCVELGYERNAAMRTALVTLVNLQRATLSDDHDRTAEAYGVDLPWHEGFFGDEVGEACQQALYPAVAKVLDRLVSLACNGQIDYTDQVWIPHVLKLQAGVTYDAVFVDEAQDLNEVQFELVKKACGPHGRLFFAGDPYQAIYLFRGAGVGMTDRIESDLEDTERGVSRMPLNYCYRCPTKVVDAVRAGGRVMHIEAAPGAKPGEILYYQETEKWTDEVQPGAMILCRTNAPLAITYYRLLREKIPATIRGRGDDGIHKKLVTLVERCESYNLAKTVERARKVSERRVATLWAARRYNEAVSAGDLFRTLSVMASEASSTLDLRRQIECMFAPDKNGVEREKVTLSTIHKAKGLEAPDVFVIRPDLLPLMCYAKTPHDIEQEKNLEYVCFTRTMERLIFVTPRSVRQRSEELGDLFPEIELDDGAEGAAPVI